MASSPKDHGFGPKHRKADTNTQRGCRATRFLAKWSMGRKWFKASSTAMILIQ